MRSSSSSLGPAPLRVLNEPSVKVITSLRFKMITARNGHLLHPDSLHPPASSASLSHIELDATKSPLALLAQTCSQIGRSDPFSPTDSSERLKINTLSSKSAEKRVSSLSPESRGVPRTQSATCRPFSICSPEKQDEDEKNETGGDKSLRDGGNSGLNSGPERNPSSSETSVGFSASSGLGFCVPAFSALPLPPFPPSCASFPCGDPYCFGYYCSPSLKSTFPLLYPSHPLPSSSASAFTLFPRPRQLQSCVFNSVAANSSETGVSPSAGSHTHVAPTLRNPHHTLRVAARYHPYFKTPLPTACSSYYSLHGLYGPRLHPAP